MRITDLLDRRSVSLSAAPKSKSEALDMAVDLMVKSEKISDREAYRKQVYAREQESTTGIGEGIAIPHGKCDAVQKPGLAAMVVKNGVEFEALDDEPVTLLFLIAAPNTEDNIHLDVLSKLSVMLMDEEFTASLRNAQSVDEFMEIIDKADDEKKDIDERLADTGSADEGQEKSWQLPPVLPELPTPIWRQKELKKRQRPETVLSRWRQEAPAEPKTFLQIRRSRRLTALSWRRMHRFPWNVLMERS